MLFGCFAFTRVEDLHVFFVHSIYYIYGRRWRPPRPRPRRGRLPTSWTTAWEPSTSRPAMWEVPHVYDQDVGGLSRVGSRRVKFPRITPKRGRPSTSWAKAWVIPRSYREGVCLLQYDLTDIVYVAADRLQVDVAKHIGERISLYQSGAVKVATSEPD